MWQDCDEQFRSASEVIEEFCKEHKLPILAGSSGRGWSKFSTIQRCPQLYEFIHIKKEKPPTTSEALDTGSIYHAFHAVEFYSISTMDLQEYLLADNVNPKSVFDARRVYDAYLSHYEEDYLNVLAVEVPAVDPKTKFTCRYDAIARIEDPPNGYLKGTYVIEMKTAGKFDFATLDSWDLDGEILGEIALYDRAGMRKKFGPLQGVIIDIAGKQQTPQFHRTFVSPSSIKTERHMRDLVIWEAQEKRYKKLGYFPRALNGCIGRYGTCGFYDVCRNEV